MDTESLARAALMTGAIALAYTYVGYPCLMALLAWIQGEGALGASGDDPAADGPPPRRRTSAIVSVAGEWRALEATTAALARSRPPPDEVIVALDGDCDQAEVDRATATWCPGVRVIAGPAGGKTLAQERAVRAATGEVLAFLDAGARPEPGALAALAEALEDPSLGVAAAVLVYEGNGPEAVYWSFETALRRWESSLGATLGAHGALYALRREDHVALPSHALSDLVEPILLHVMRGRRTAVVGAARVIEPCPGRTWARKRRITWRALASLPLVMPALDPLARPALALAFVSHKVLRWLTWLWTLALVGGALVTTATPWDSLASVTILAVTALGLGQLRAGSLLGLPGYALEVLLAQAAGTLAALAGRRLDRWRPTDATRDTRPEASDPRPIPGAPPPPAGTSMADPPAEATPRAP